MLKTFTKAILAGLMIGIGGIVYLSAENKVVGAFLFSFGLFTIVRAGFALYTGKVGYIPENKPKYILEVLVTFAGNVAGTGLTALILSFTRIWDKIHTTALGIMEGKIADSIPSRFVLGIFCGMLMYLAVENGKNCRDKSDVSFVFGICVPVMIFILSGFNHSVADCFYYFSASPNLQGALYILTVALGNAVGGMLIPATKKYIIKE
ncbi:MAG: formate/nitrite transporter family protein [Ruminococcus flavefaciens]|nr:formate/nitrite transporter family protein [Ruminococcus flavefaciens]MCM1228612.1 formate/nitrite transporter family protein [Ruminococcus flavefaciens]